MNHSLDETLSRAGTVIIAVASIAIVVAGLVHLIMVRRRWAPSSAAVARATAVLNGHLGPTVLDARARLRAVRLTAQYLRFRSYVRWMYRVPMALLIVGEIAHLAANTIALRHGIEIRTWRVVSNGGAFLGSVLVLVFIPRVLLAALPRLAVVGGVLTASHRIAQVSDEDRYLHGEDAMRALGTLAGLLTSYYQLSFVAADAPTRQRLMRVNDGLHRRLSRASQAVMFAPVADERDGRDALWTVLAALAADPVVLTTAESWAATGSPSPDAPRSRRSGYRIGAAAMVLVLGAAVAGLWLLDQNAVSVAFPAVIAPLLVPAIVGFTRLGWSNRTAGRVAAEMREVEIPEIELPEPRHDEVAAAGVG